MGMYRKKPVVIEAVKWNGETLTETPEWIMLAVKEGRIYETGNEILIYTLEGTMTVSSGDYIIKGVNNELYPCKPDIFKKTYEPA
jgi:hypothetical protein